MKRPHEFKPRVDPLESRSMLSADIYAYAPYDVLQASYAAQAKATTNPVVFFGDSMTYRWGTAGAATFAQDFAPLGATNFGVPGDTSAQAIARVQAGDFAGKPAVAVVMIGDNDLGQGATPLQAATGALDLVRAIQSASPRTSILLLGLLPTVSPSFNLEVMADDGLLAAIGKLPGVTYEDPEPLFAAADGTAKPGLLSDVVHPTAAGYSLLASAIEGTVDALDREALVAVPHATSGRLAPLVPVVQSSAINPNAGVFVPLTPVPPALPSVVATPSVVKAKSCATELITAP